ADPGAHVADARHRYAAATGRDRGDADGRARYIAGAVNQHIAGIIVVADRRADAASTRRGRVAETTDVHAGIGAGRGVGLLRENTVGAGIDVAAAGDGQAAGAVRENIDAVGRGVDIGVGGDGYGA